MNKDVVYIEPEDDITDIIARVKNAKQKLVALVPPKKIGVLRSAVNTKLIAKAARQADKVVVVVTTDSSLIKLAAAAGVPVAKTLQSRPKLPSELIEETKEAPGEQIIDENDFPEDETSTQGAGVPKSANSATSAKQATSVKNQHSQSQSANAKKSTTADQNLTSDDLEKDDKSKKGKKSGKNIPVFEKYRKWFIIGGAAFVLLVVFIVWALVFAPSATIAVAIRTTTNNFSENVGFATKTGTENTKNGVFLLEKKQVEKTSSVEFTATGQKDIGEKATGSLSVVAKFSSSESGAIALPAGSEFFYNSYKYVTNGAVSLENPEDCKKSDYNSGNCTSTTAVAVTAAQSGADYNIGAHDSGWNTPDNSVLSAYNASAFTGGTTNMVTVVSQTDFDNAKNKLENTGKEDGKSELSNQFGSDMVVISSSLETSTSEPKSTPAVGEEVKSGVTPKVEATTTYTLYAVDKTALEGYIKEKAGQNLASDQKIYAVDTPFFDNFVKSDSGAYTAKLKSSTQTGPKVTEEDILEKSKGKKVGEVQSLLKSINGVSSVNVKTSFFWVKKVPNDANKVTVELKVEE